MSTIKDLAAEIDRLCPSQVDRSISGNGSRTAGHIGHEHDEEWPSVGWFCSGGNAGNSVFAIHPQDVGKAVDRLRAMEDGSLDDSGLTDAFKGLRVDWQI